MFDLEKNITVSKDEKKTDIIKIEKEHGSYLGREKTQPMERNEVTAVAWEEIKI